ncbi:MAG: alpha/beta fold hydrolase [Planctomycetota bacterium]
MTLGRRIANVLAAVYGALLVASWITMEARDAPPAGPGLSTARWLATPTHGAPHEVTVAYSDRGPKDAPVVVLLHGSPGAHTDFDRVTLALEDRFRCIAVDLPGFGASSRWVPDYSIEAHAAYTLELMDQLGVERAHLVGYSMGSGVALEVYARAPKRVRSATLFAGLGVEELELFGDHTLNHGLHQLQLLGLRLLRFAVPHFGALDDFPLNVTYARNFADTDQRRLRGILAAFEPPLLILHGEEDFLVPVAAAREHARIVPQSELVVITRADVPELPADASLGPGHFMPYRFPALSGARIGRFLDAVERGTAARRRDATEARERAAAAPFDPATVPPFQGPALMAILVLLALGTLISEDLACIAAGLLVADARLGFAPAAAACFVGILAGDMLLFLAGRLFGRAALGRRPLRWFVSEDAVARASRWFTERGVAMIFISRLTPGLRLPTYVAAGVLRTSILKFGLFFALAGLVWVPALVGVAAVLGREAAEALGGLGWSNLPWLVAFVLLLRELFSTVPLLMTHRGRRLLRGRWIRRTQWEYWPTWLTYLPILAYIAWLGVRHGGLSKVTAANPAIPGGGIVGESKSEILRGLGDAPEVPPWTLLPASLAPHERAARARAFVAEHALEFPVILKPDAGQRGSGVYAAQDHAELDAAVRRHQHDTLIQARLEGPEFGVFYIRHPREEVGRIFAITVKVLPTVTGDGRRTLEELVLDDPRACALHAVYGRENAARFDLVVPRGEVVQLVDVGTHARGALFLDGRRYVTPALLEAVDRISKRFEGFHFGRYDLKAPSAEHLARGEGLGVIELNGVTSEATNVYDPALGIREAYRTLFAQWRAAYAIGAHHAARGVPTVGVVGVLREWWRYRRAQSGHTTSVDAERA